MLPIRSVNISNNFSGYKIPSKSSLRKIKVELKLKEQPSESYRPGDTIEGDLFIQRTDSSSIINDVWFNQIEIKFQNVTMLHPAVEAKAKAKVNFTMSNSPDLTNFNKFSKDYEFQDCSFPFKFVIPLKHLDNICDNYLVQHENLIPSFGAPQLCGVAFGADCVAGLTPVESESFKRFQNVPYNQFSNYYAITAEISQKFPNSTADPYVVFKRSLEVKVVNQFDVIPTNISESSIDVASYYNISDTDSSNELSLIKTIGFKNSDNLMVGSIMCSSLLPSAMTEDSTTSFPIDLKYRPIVSNKVLPRVRASIKLNQYVIQSQVCLPPIANQTDLPEDYKMTIDGLVRKRKLTQKVQTVYENSSFEFDKKYSEWVPDYNDENTYISQLTISIPPLKKDELFQPTFHSCHLQNFYILSVDLVFSEEDNNELKKGSNLSWGQIIGLKKKSNKNVKELLNKNTISISVPIIVT